MRQVRDELLPDRLQAPQLGDVMDEHERVAGERAGHQLDLDGALAVRQPQLALGRARAQRLQQPALPGRVQQAQRELVRLEPEELASDLVGGEDPSVPVQEQHHNWRLLQQVLEGAGRLGRPVVIPAQSLTPARPHHGPEYRDGPAGRSVQEARSGCPGQPQP